MARQVAVRGNPVKHSMAKKAASSATKAPATPAGYDLLRRADWIWPEGYMYLHNHFAHFRYDFVLPAGMKGVPAQTPLYITADKGYRLYVNGKSVCRGPARGYQAHWPYDEVDVRPYLQPGANWFAVEAYTPGISTFSYLHCTKAGFLCAADWGVAKIASGRDWLMRRSPAHRRDTARLSMQLDFQEHYHAAQDDRRWITDATPPQGWNRNLFENGQNITQFPFGQPPFEDVEARGIPLLREDLLVPSGVTGEGVGRNAEGWRGCENVAWHWMDREFSTVEQWRDGKAVKSRRTAQALEIVIDPAAADSFRAVTVDLGEISVGTLNVEVERAEGRESLDFLYHQCLRKGHPEYLKPGNGCHVALASRLLPAQGRCAHEFFHIMGIRHITIVARDLKAPLTLRLNWRTALYPFAMRGAFACSDAALNAIHAACRRTQQICAIDAYVDTPWREQAQWWGDARVQARNTFYLDGDARLLARGIRSLAGQRAPQGLTYGHAPTCSGWCILPDFALTWVMTVWDYYWQTGDLTLFREQQARMEEIFAYFESPQARGKDGLLTFDPRFWLFEDWAALAKENIPTFLNLWHLYTLEHYARLLEAAGMRPQLAARKKEIAARRRLLVRKLFDPKSGLFLSNLGNNGKPTAAPSVHDQVLALLLNLTPQAKGAMLDQILLPCIREEKLAGAQPSAFWATYLFDCLREAGEGALVVDYIRRHWEPMLSTGTTWEGYHWNEGEGGTCSHAWTSHPCFHFVNILAGITQTAVGWTQARLAPVFPQGMDFAEATVPAPQGELAAHWRRQGETIAVAVTLPKGIRLEVDLPGIAKTLTKAGRYEFTVTAGSVPAPGSATPARRRKGAART